MKRVGIILILLVVGAVGCKSKPMDWNRAVDSWKGQPRWYTVVEYTGLQSWSMTGTNITIRMQGPLPQLNPLPKPASTVDKAIDASASVARSAVLGICGYKAIKASKPVFHEVRPEVIEKDVEIVRP